MEGTAPTTLAERLDALTDAVRRSTGVDLRGLTAPGLDGDAITALTRAAGIDLPSEARRWFSWQDGPIDPVPGALGPGLNGQWRLISLKTAVDDMGIGDGEGWGDADDEAGPWVDRDGTLLPIAINGGGGRLLIDPGAGGDLAPVTVFHPGPDNTGRPLFPSISAMVETVTRAFERGLMVPDGRSDGGFEYRRYPLPPDLHLVGFW